MDKSKIRDITIGVLFRKSFRIMDDWGSIADSILSKEPFFSPEYFSNISSQYNTQGQLSNPETGNYLLLSAENLIYKHVVGSSFDKDFKDFKERIIKCLLPDVIYKNELKVMRLGIVYSYELENSESEQFMKRYFRPECKYISDLRFSKKEPDTVGGTVSGVSDYHNIIYTVGSIGDNKRGITLDYQYWFSPAREYITDLFGKFIQSSFNVLSKEVSFE